MPCLFVVSRPQLSCLNAAHVNIPLHSNPVKLKILCHFMYFMFVFSCILAFMYVVNFFFWFLLIIYLCAFKCKGFKLTKQECTLITL